MAVVVSFINMKGGVGKTTLTVNVAYGLAYYFNKKVLLVDVDPQFNASTYLLTSQNYIKHRDDKAKRTIVDIFQPPGSGHFNSVKGKKKKKKYTPNLSSYTTRIYNDKGHLDIIPSELRLITIQDSERGTENRLRNFIRKRATKYDYVLIDCPPTISIFTQAAILASDQYIVPVKPDPLSTIGLPLLEKWLYNYTDSVGIDIICVGVVFSFVREQTNQAKQVIKELRRKRTDEIFKSHLGHSVKISESVEKHKPIFIYKPSSKWASQMYNIIVEFLERIEGVK